MKFVHILEFESFLNESVQPQKPQVVDPSPWPFPSEEAVKKAKTAKKKPCVAKATTRPAKKTATKTTKKAK